MGSRDNVKKISARVLQKLKAGNFTPKVLPLDELDPPTANKVLEPTE